VPSQQPKGQLQTQHSLDPGNYIINKQKLQASTGGRKRKKNNNRIISNSTFFIQARTFLIDILPLSL
jgi:hypothetical protein